jgi:GNAT superfamily N-acetyltransferase
VAVFADLDLARRLELTEGHGNAAFVESQALRDPESGATWQRIGGTFAMFAGAGSPITQTFGLGMHEPLVDGDLDAIEQFFKTRGSPVFHEVCPLAGVEVYGKLASRGYQPMELSSVMFRDLATEPAAGTGSRIRVRAVDPDEAESYAQLAARGWFETPEVVPMLLGFARSSVEVGRCFIAELDGVAVASGALFIHQDVALLAGASTVPEGRRRGAQSALLDARLRGAAANGCTIAMMVAAPGSASQRNAERNGFRIAYTRTKWQL